MAQVRSDNILADLPKILDDKVGVFDGAPPKWRAYNTVSEFVTRFSAPSTSNLVGAAEGQMFWVRNTLDSNKADLYSLRKDKTPYKVFEEVDLSNYYTKSETDNLILIETNARIAGDQTNATAIADETTRATNAEQAIANDLSQEVIRATNVEGSLQTQINTKANSADVSQIIEVNLVNGATTITNTGYADKIAVLFDLVTGDPYKLTFDSSGVASLGFTVVGSFNGLLAATLGNSSGFITADQIGTLVKGNLYFPMISDNRFDRFIDIWAGSASMYNQPFKLVICNKGGNVGVKSGDVSFTVASTKTTGIELFKAKVGSDVVFWAINWDLDKPNVFVPDGSDETVTATIPRTYMYTELFNMFINQEFSITANVTFNSDGIMNSATVTWKDGQEGTLTKSNYDTNVIEYRDLTVSYIHPFFGLLQVKYPTITYDELSNIILETPQMQVIY